MNKFSLTFSTATLPGLVQGYVEVKEVLHGFVPDMGALRRALDSPDTREKCISSLQCGATALNALEALGAGDIEYTATLLKNIVRGQYSEAAALGRSDRTLTVDNCAFAVEVSHE